MNPCPLRLMRSTLFGFVAISCHQSPWEKDSSMFTPPSSYVGNTAAVAGREADMAPTMCMQHELSTWITHKHSQKERRKTKGKSWTQKRMHAVPNSLLYLRLRCIVQSSGFGVPGIVPSPCSNRYVPGRGGWTTPVTTA